MQITLQRNYNSPVEQLTTLEELDAVFDSESQYRKVTNIRGAREAAQQLESGQLDVLQQAALTGQWFESPGYQKWRLRENAAIAYRNKQRGAGAAQPELPIDERPEAERLRLYADALKRSLPGIIFMASDFDETLRAVKRTDADGKVVVEQVKGKWRVQKAARLNGIAVLDSDHLPQPVEQWFSQTSPEQLRQLGVLLVFITSSRAGVKVVFIARSDWGDLISNAHRMAQELGLPCDPSGADASRMAFAPSSRAGDILFYDRERLITFSNADYDAQFGDAYRNAGSAAASAVPSAGSSEVQKFSISDCLVQSVPVQKIVDAWLGPVAPVPGTRHKTSLLLADHLRYVVGPNATAIEAILRAQPFVADIVKERGEDVAATVRSALAYREEKRIPLRMYRAMRSAGVSTDSGQHNPLPYAEWYERFKHLPKGCYDPATRFIKENYTRVGGIITASGMYNTLLTDCYYLDWEGRYHRLNTIAFVIGGMTEGKGFAVRQDEAIMEPLRQEDAPGRHEERDYKTALNERETSTKEQRKDALKRPQLSIRYCPVKTSNNVLYHRLQNAAIQQPDGTIHYRHIYIFASELLSFVNATGSFQEKRDILLHSFSNERNGVDYANKDSVNDTMPVHLNFVATGTRTALEKVINLRNIGDGFSTRVSSYLLPSNGAKWRKKATKPEDPADDQEMRQWGERFINLKGEIKGLKRLVDHVYDIVAARAEEAADTDKVTFTICKRLQDKVMAVCIPQVISTQKSWDDFASTMTVRITQQHLKFADLVCDVLFRCEDALFGQLMQEHYDTEERDVQMRNVYDKTADYFALLPDNFSTTDVMRIWGYTSNTTASTRIATLVDQKLVEKLGRGSYHKLVSTL